MKCQEIIEEIEKRYPREYACEWDNVGLLAGDRQREVKRIYIALDATDRTIDRAVSFGAELLLTHHPLIFGGIRSVTADDCTGRRLIKLIENGISCYAMHTNYDVLGMASLASDLLGLTETSVLEEVRDGEGIGRTGKLPKEMTLKECACYVKERFSIPDVRIFGDPEGTVSTAAISPGSGKSMTHPALKKGADVLISGDIDHHTGIDMADSGLSIIDAGHYGLEHIYIADMENFLRERFPELVIETALEEQPFLTL